MENCVIVILSVKVGTTRVLCTAASLVPRRGHIVGAPQILRDRPRAGCVHLSVLKCSFQGARKLPYFLGGLILCLSWWPESQSW